MDLASICHKYSPRLDVLNSERVVRKHYVCSFPSRTGVVSYMSYRPHIFLSIPSKLTKVTFRFPHVWTGWRTGTTLMEDVLYFVHYFAV